MYFVRMNIKQLKVNPINLQGSPKRHVTALLGEQWPSLGAVHLVSLSFTHSFQTWCPLLCFQRNQKPLQRRNRHFFFFLVKTYEYDPPSRLGSVELGSWKDNKWFRRQLNSPRKIPAENSRTTGGWEFHKVPRTESKHEQSPSLPTLPMKWQWNNSA